MIQLTHRLKTRSFRNITSSFIALLIIFLTNACGSKIATLKLAKEYPLYNGKIYIAQVHMNSKPFAAYDALQGPKFNKGFYTYQDGANLLKSLQATIAENNLFAGAPIYPGDKGIKEPLGDKDLILKIAILNNLVAETKLMNTEIAFILVDKNKEKIFEDKFAVRTQKSGRISFNTLSLTETLNIGLTYRILSSIMDKLSDQPVSEFNSYQEAYYSENMLENAKKMPRDLSTQVCVQWYYNANTGARNCGEWKTVWYRGIKWETHVQEFPDGVPWDSMNW